MRGCSQAGCSPGALDPQPPCRCPVESRAAVEAPPSMHNIYMHSTQPLIRSCLRQEDLLGGDLHAQVTAGNHDGIWIS